MSINALFRFSLLAALFGSCGEPEADVSEGAGADVVGSVAVGPAMAQVTAEQLKANRGFYAEGDLEIEWIRSIRASGFTGLSGIQGDINGILLDGGLKAWVVLDPLGQDPVISLVDSKKPMTRYWLDTTEPVSVCMVVCGGEALMTSEFGRMELANDEIVWTRIKPGVKWSGDMWRNPENRDVWVGLPKMPRERSAIIRVQPDNTISKVTDDLVLGITKQAFIGGRLDSYSNANEETRILASSPTPMNGEILEFNTDGELLRRIQGTDGEFNFGYSFDITKGGRFLAVASEDSVADDAKDRLYLHDLDGNSEPIELKPRVEQQVRFGRVQIWENENWNLVAILGRTPPRVDLYDIPSGIWRGAISIPAKGADAVGNYVLVLEPDHIAITIFRQIEKYPTVHILALHSK
ncbi:MAG: hypothetical protein HQ519_11740 [Planctomycetes bacterium]|nr:hypothetical protein [Planctomycetota bacterium]